MHVEGKAYLDDLLWRKEGEVLTLELIILGSYNNSTRSLICTN